MALLRETARDAAIYSCTQVGKTFWAACWNVAQAWEHPRTSWGWYAPTEKQMKIGFAQVLALFATIVAPGGVNQADHTIRLINGSTLQFYTWNVNKGEAGANTLQGPPLAGGVVDEAGLLTNRAATVISSRRSATLGPMRYIGNPGLTTGPFRVLCSMGEDPDRNKRLIATYRWTWRELANAIPCPCGILAGPGVDPDPVGHQDGCRRRDYVEFMAMEKATKPDMEYRRLYEAEWTADANALFRPDMVDTKTTGEPWEGPVEGRRYAVGVDVGQEVDYLVAAVWDVKSQRLGYGERWRGVPSYESEQRLKKLSDRWNGAVLHIEINNTGRPLFDGLVRLGAPCEEWVTTAQSKGPAVLELVRAVHDPSSKVSLAPLHPLQDELKSYRYLRMPGGNYRYEAPSGLHDDWVMAAVIGYQAISSPAAAAVAPVRTGVRYASPRRGGAFAS